MSGKKTGSGMGARVAAASGRSQVTAALDATIASELPEPPTEAATPPATKAEVVAINIRLPKAMHRTLREIAFKDETSINAILIEAATEWLAKAR